MAPYGFDPAGPTPPLVPVRELLTCVLPVSVVPVSSVSAAALVSAPVVEPLLLVCASSGGL